MIAKKTVKINKQIWFLKMRVLYIALGLCVCLLASVIVFLPNFVNWNDYRVQLAESIEQSMGRDVMIAGGLHLELVPRPIIRIEDLKIKNRLDAKHEDFLKIKNIEADLSIKDLLFGNLVMQNIVLKRPAIYFDVLPNGTKAWDVQSETAQKTSILDGLSKNIAFDDIQIEDGTISFYNGVSDKSYLFEKGNFILKTDSQSGPFSIIGTSLYQGQLLDFNMTSSGLKKEGTAFNATIMRADKSLHASLKGMYRDNTQGVFIDGDLDVSLASVKNFTAVDAPLKAQAKINFIHKKTDLSSTDRFRLNTQEINGALGNSKIKGQMILDYNGAQSNSKYLFSHDYTIHIDQASLGSKAEISSFIDFIPQGFGKGFIKIDNLTGDEAQSVQNVTVDYARQVIDNDQSLININDARMMIPDNGTVAMSGTVLSDQEGHDYTLKFDLDMKDAAALNPYLKDMPNIPDNVGLKTVLNVRHGKDGDTELKTDSAIITDLVNQDILVETAFDLSNDGLTIKGQTLNADRFFAEDSVTAMVEDLFTHDQETTRDISIAITELTLNKTMIKGLDLQMQIDKGAIDVTALKADDMFGTILDVNGSYIFPNTQNVNAEIALNGTLKSDDLSRFIKEFEGLTDQKAHGLIGRNLLSSLLQKTTKSDIVIDLKDEKPEGAEIALSGMISGADIQLNMTAKNRDFDDKIDGVLRIKGENLNDLLPLFDLDKMNTELPYDFYAKITGDDNDLKIDGIKTTVKRRAFTGSIRQLSDRLRIDLSADMLNPEDIILFNQAQKIIQTKESEGDISLKVKRLKGLSLFNQFTPVTLEKIHVKGRFDKKAIIADDIKFALNDALGRGDVTLNANGDRHARLSFDDVALDNFNLALPIKGDNADIDLQIKHSAGDKTIKGTGNVTMRKGLLTGVDLGAVMSGLATLSSSDQSRKVLREAFASGETEFSRAKASFAIDGNVTSFDEIDIAGDFGKISATAGTYNRGKDSYELPLDFSLVTPVNLPKFMVYMRESGNETDASDLEAFFSKSIKERAKPTSQNFDDLLKTIKKQDQ